MTREDIVILIKEVKKSKGQVLLEYKGAFNNDYVNVTAEISDCTSYKKQILFILAEELGYINVKIPDEGYDVYTLEEKEKDITQVSFIDFSLICKTEKKSLDEICQNINFYVDKSIKEEKRKQYSYDTKVDIESFWESIDNMLEK